MCKSKKKTWTMIFTKKNKYNENHDHIVKVPMNGINGD